MEKNFKNVINFVRGRKKNPRHGFALCQEGVIFYDEDKNEIVFVSSDGYIRTYFKPSEGINYYNRQ